MYFANRIGTPVMHDLGQAATTFNPGTYAGFVVDTQNVNTKSITVVNAAPVSEYGVTHLRTQHIADWVRGKTFAIGQQFTLPPAKNGNAIGIELTGWFCCSIHMTPAIFPAVGQLNGAAAAAFDVVGMNNQWTAIDPPAYQIPNDTVSRRLITWRTQVLIAPEDYPSGVWWHGAVIQDGGTGANVPGVGYFEGRFGMRNSYDPNQYVDARRN